MKTFTASLLFAAGVVSTAYAEHGNHARHQDLHDKRQLPAYMAKPHPNPNGDSCGCYTYTTTWYGAPTLIPDLRDYSNTTSAGWETIAPEPTATSSASAVVEPTTISSTFKPRRKSGSSSNKDSKSSSCSEKPKTYDAPSAYEKKASTTPQIYEKKASTTSSATPTSKAKPTSYAAPSSSSTSSSASPSSTSAHNAISPNGNKWAFCYTPYASDGQCKTAEAVASDVAGIKAKGFTSVRLYATDCDGPQNVGKAAAEQGLKLILGIWVDEAGIGAKTDEQIDVLTKWGSDKWDLVEMVVAGNEAMFYGYTDAPGLASFVNDVRSKFRAAGYQGPVGTSEVIGSFIDNADVLCPAVDYAAANIHPFFNADVAAADAGDFVVKQLADVSAACGDAMPAYNLESGWPSLGSPNGLAVPGAGDQKIAIESIMEKAGGKTAIFSYENDSWKAPGEFGVEQHWGCSELFE